MRAAPALRPSLPALLAPLALLGLLAPLPTAAQSSPGGVGEACGSAAASCTRAAVGLQAARGALGLAFTGGAAVPGTASTLGKRVGSEPRFAFTLRGGMTRAPLPVPGTDPMDEEGAWVPSLRGSLAFNLFNGLTVAPTVGGILAVDVVGSVGNVRASSDDGFDEGVLGGGGGLRIGVLRESFTMPGITLTATRHWLARTRFGPWDQPGAEASRFSTTVTSLRGTVGKEFFAFGVLGGLGWERYGGEGTVRGSDFGPGSGSPVEAFADDLRSDRTLVFGGVSYNILILQFGLEAGWASGFDAVPGLPEGDYRPGDDSLFAALSFRLVL